MTSSPTRTGHVCTQQSNYDVLVYANQLIDLSRHCIMYCILTGYMFSGTNVTYSLWSIAEAAISTICICLPNILYLIRRARHHGIGALFTSREYDLSANVSRSKTTVPGSTSTGGFLCVDGITSLAVDGNCDDGSLPGMQSHSSVGALAQDRQRSEDGEAIGLSRVYLRQHV